MKNYFIKAVDVDTKEEFYREGGYTADEKELFTEQVTKNLLGMFWLTLGKNALYSDIVELYKKNDNDWKKIDAEARRALPTEQFYKDALQAIDDLFNGKISEFTVNQVDIDNSVLVICAE